MTNKEGHPLSLSSRRRRDLLGLHGRRLTTINTLRVEALEMLRTSASFPLFVIPTKEGSLRAARKAFNYHQHAKRPGLRDASYLSMTQWGVRHAFRFLILRNEGCTSALPQKKPIAAHTPARTCYKGQRLKMKVILAVPPTLSYARRSPKVRIMQMAADTTSSAERATAEGLFKQRI